MPEAELFACAGVWRNSDEWGECYSMVMTDSGGAVSDVHTRMPVILATKDYAVWTGGSPDDALGLCRPWDGDVSIERSDQPWGGGAAVQRSLL